MTTTKSKASQPLKWHGGKAYLAKQIIALMPPRVKNPNAPADSDPGWVHYVELFFGGGAVLFQLDPEGISEVVNDRNFRLTNFWNVLKSSEWFAEFYKLVTLTPFSEWEYRAAEIMECDVTGPDAAAAFFIRYRQSRQGLGKCFSTLVRNRARQGMQEQVAAWLSAVDGLPEAHARLRRVAILNHDAIDVIRQQDGPRTLFYCDPPYLHETRHASARDAYECEMSVEQHAALLDTLAAIKGRFILSGYPSALYRDRERDHGWRRMDIEIDNKSSGAKVKEKKTECLWMNY